MNSKEIAVEVLRAQPIKTTKEVDGYSMYLNYCKYIGVKPEITWIDGGVDHRTGYQKQIRAFNVKGNLITQASLTRALKKQI